jgi:single-stranded-DNA-specific exonuclease
MHDGMLRHWIDPQPVDTPTGFHTAVGGHRLVADILYQRGIHSLDAAQAFISPDDYQPSPAFVLPGIQRACERIEQAVRNEEKICIWGDFDVDGQTSTTLLVSALRALAGAAREHLVQFHIPVRALESHGVNWEYLEPILQAGTSLVVTCDTGITSHEVLARAQRMGVDVIITDHHDLPDQLPEACAVVNPKLLEKGHPLSGLPGVGVAFKLVEELFARAGMSAQAGQFLDLAALGIVSDLAHQTADTRWLLQRGLQALRSTSRTGLKMMMEMCRVQQGNLTEEHIGFLLGPRLNALGRLDDANPAVELLTTQDAGKARILATHLEGLNARRRLLTEQVLQGALAQLDKDPSLLEQAALVLSHPDWPAGVVGIVASELAERFNRPAVLLAAPPGQPARGSARSIEGVNISEAIAASRHLLLGFGGHPMAAGLSIDPERIPAFRRSLSKWIDQALGGTAPRPTLSVDGWVGLDELNLGLVTDLERLAPFGPGNPPVVLAVRGVTILSSTTIGRDGDHLQVIVKDEQDRTQRVIWWRGAGWPLPEGLFDLACVVRSSNYRGQVDIQVEWIDARPVESEAVQSTRQISMIDQRDLDHPLPVLQRMMEETSAVVWCEAEAHNLIPSSDRCSLTNSDTLIIWTTPPGPFEFQQAVEMVRPKILVVFAIDPQESGAEGFLKRLAGLTKHVIEAKNGRADLAWLAAATAQRETSVRLGLRWLEQRGLISAGMLENGAIQIAPGTGSANAEAGQTVSQLRKLLEETAAYRVYFKTAEKEHLL